MGRVFRIMIMTIGVFLAASCQHGPTVVAPPVPPAPAPGPLPDAEAALRSAQYSLADGLYQQLSERSSAEREIALARRAFIRALPGTELYDPAGARALLAQLTSEFPMTMYATDVEALLGVLPGVELTEDRLQAVLDNARRERELLGAFLEHSSPLDPQFDPERARADYRRLLAEFPDSQSRKGSERILFLLSERERLIGLGAEMDEEIRALDSEVGVLSQELKRLKEIDLGRQLPD